MAAEHSTPLRVCTRCAKSLLATLDNFPPHRMGKFGLHSQCRACRRIGEGELRNRPDQRARQKAWRDANKERIRSYNRAYRDSGYCSTAHVAAWRRANIEHARRAEAERNRRRRASDDAYRLKCRLAARLGAMLGGKGGRSTEALVGYSAHELCRHIERQFHGGMSWEALRSGLIDIDHIVPVSSFKITDINDPMLRVCWGLANLRPMWSKDNRKKGAKRLTLL